MKEHFWNVIFDGIDTPQNHMDKDSTLLKDISSLNQPTLRFYEWDGPAATYGHFIEPERFLNLQVAEENKLKLGKRPTGGGIIFHLKDLAFSVLVPASCPAYSINTLENYHFINTIVSKALLRWNQETNTFSFNDKEFSLLPEEKTPLDPLSKHFCMAKPTIYDIMLGGKKVGGAAQRRTKEGFLHQGSISLGLPDESFLQAVLRQDTNIFEEMKEHTYYFQKSLDVLKARQDLTKLLVQEFNYVVF